MFIIQSFIACNMLLYRFSLRDILEEQHFSSAPYCFNLYFCYVITEHWSAPCCEVYLLKCREPRSGLIPTPRLSVQETNPKSYATWSVLPFLLCRLWKPLQNKSCSMLNFIQYWSAQLMLSDGKSLNTFFFWLVSGGHVT